MTDYTKEQFEQLPDFAKKDFTEVDGVYRHAGFAKVKTTADQLDAKARSYAAELEAVRAGEQAKIDEARKQAFDDAVKTGKTDVVLKQLTEQLENEKKTRAETQKQYEDRIAAMSEAAKKKATEARIKGLSSLATDDARPAFERLLRHYIDANPETMQNVYLDDDGRATSMSDTEFEASLAKNQLFKPLLKASMTTSGGGGLNGSGARGGVPQATMSRQEFDNLPPDRRAKFMKDGGTLKS
jgi:hypothetical protein